MKYLFLLLITLVAIFFCSWSFNHLGAWEGIGITVAFIFVAVYFIINFIKKHSK